MNIVFPLLLAANLAAQESYVIDLVCQGAVRTYRIEGWEGSVWEWKIRATDGTEVLISQPTGIDFTASDEEGHFIQGSETTIVWNVAPGNYSLSTRQTSTHGCVSHELGEVEVFPAPEADVQKDIILCNGEPVLLDQVTANFYSSLFWETNGDGTFSNTTTLNPTYTPGAADVTAGSAVLTLRANGMGLATSCEAAVSSLTIKFSNLMTAIVAETDVCEGTEVQLNGNPSGGSGIYTAHEWRCDSNHLFFLNAPDIVNPIIRNTAPAGKYTFTYTVTDDAGQKAVDQIIVNINDLPVANIDAETDICEGTAAQLFGVASGGSKVYDAHEWTGNELQIAYLTRTDIQNPVLMATAPAGTYTYTYTVTDKFGCIGSTNATLKVIGQNSATSPEAENDYAITMSAKPVKVDVISNDVVGNGAFEGPSITIVSKPANGKGRVHSTGALTYYPDFGFIGTDTLSYSICNDFIACGPMCDTAFVIINVKLSNQPPAAVNDSFTVMCQPLNEYLLQNDYDPDGDIIKTFQWPIIDVKHGKVSIEQDGTFVYIHDKGFSGIDSFVYRIYDDGYPELWDEAMVWIYVMPEEDCNNLPGNDNDSITICQVLIPEGFSPNGDGIHDFFQIYCIEEYPEAVLHIFDRAGNKLFEKYKYGNLNYWGSDENAWWWGVSEHKLISGRRKLPAGIYLYMLKLGNGEVLIGTVMIVY